MTAEHFHEQMFTIRYFEERILELFSLGKLNGTTHAYIGQEANAVGLISHLSSDDIIWSNHRCHGHYLTYTKDIQGLIHELMGNTQGTCGGRGGSQHLCKGNFYTNGVQGGIVPVATGMALAEKLNNSSAITAVFLGDGTLGEGVVYESFNMASLWKLPILFVVENNNYAQSTPSRLQLSGTIKGRGEAFSLAVFEASSNDVFVTHEISGAAVKHVREKREPAMLVLETYRTCSHSKSDDNRPQAEIDEWKKKDPLLVTRKALPAERIAEIEKQVKGLVEDAIEQALDAREK